jgi:nucleoside-diphosphate-sugar epimerase
MLSRRRRGIKGSALGWQAIGGNASQYCRRPALSITRAWQGRTGIRKVLVTGAAGFIGLALAERLARDEAAAVVLVDRLAPEHWDESLRALAARPNVTYRQADLADSASLATLPRDVEAIFHLAAVIGVEQVMRAPDRVLEVNALSTLNVFNYARGLPRPARVLFSSTSETYAGTLRHFDLPIPTPESVPLSIEDVTLPRSSYALSKIYGEAVAFAWRRIHGVPIAVVRYHNVYGPRMGFRHVIPETFVKIAHSTGVIDVPSARHTRAFCFIDDAVEATIRCAEAADTEGQIVHVGAAEEEIEIGRLVRKIAATMQREIEIRELPETPGSPRRRCPDTTKLERLTGYRARVSLDDGLRRTYAWYEHRLPRP